MQKLDHLGWVAGLSFTAYGLRIGIRVTDGSVLGPLERCLPPIYDPSSSPEVEILYSLVVGGEGPRPGLRRYHLLYLGPSRLARALDLETVLGTLESNLARTIAELARDRLFIHAGVVGWQGRTLLLPGRSLSGKTSLVASLVRAGATYYSDEYAVLDGQGRVHPYPRPLQIREPTTGETRKCPVETLGGRAGTMALPVGLVAVSEYHPAATWRPRRLSPSRALLAMLSHTIPARTNPALALSVLGRVVSEAPIVCSRRGEAEQLAPALLTRRWGVSRGDNASDQLLQQRGVAAGQL